jgi:hypothetical protein
MLPEVVYYLIPYSYLLHLCAVAVVVGSLEKKVQVYKKYVFRLETHGTPAVNRGGVAAALFHFHSSACVA